MGIAKSEFFYAIKEVKSGKDVLLTERGKPIAVIKPLGVEDDYGCRHARKADAHLVLPRAYQTTAHRHYHQ